MKIIYIGGNGMLGRDFMEEATRSGVAAQGLDLPALDITSRSSVESSLPACDVVINGAAFTRVDDAEKEQDLAHCINATGAGHVAGVCAARRIRLIHISTDYVFNGRKGSAYDESDSPDPLSVYGVSKLAGEQLVGAAGGSSLIVRTQSLYGIHGRNFVKAIINQLRLGKKELKVVEDQISSPTYTRHLARALLKLANVPQTGVVNVACSGFCSWHRFAVEIVNQLGVQDVLVKPMKSAELNYPAPRPAYSVLSTKRYSEWTGETMPSWEEGLRAYLKEEPTAQTPIQVAPG